MIAAGSLEYAQARIWARWGTRPDEALWHRLETTRELAAVLELARGTPLARWVEGLRADSGLHATELALRRRWRECVHELAGWMPADWCAPLAWCATLADLPLVQSLARGEPAPPWAADDERLRPLVDPAAAADGAHATPAGEGHALQRLLASARVAPERTPALWIEGWRQRLPDGAAGAAVAGALLPLLLQHAHALERPGLDDAWALRRALHAQLATLMRRRAQEPLAAFAYLALVALELERLRGELVRRSAFPRRWPTA